MTAFAVVATLLLTSCVASVNLSPSLDHSIPIGNTEAWAKRA